MTEIKPGERITITAVVESAGHDDQHVIVRIGGRPVQVPIPADATLPARDARHHLDLTCGACQKEFGTNCDDDDIRCAECGAHRCPHCGGWFGED